MDTAGQLAQPVPLFYGRLTSDEGVVQDLDLGFDYVITSILLSNDSADAIYVTIADESGVRIFGLGCAGDPSGSISNAMFVGEMPIGPRTELQLATDASAVDVYIGGYALNPPTALSV